MGDHPHAVRYQEAMEAFNEGNLDAFEDLVADDIEWWEIGASEPVRGKDALKARMTQEMGEWEITGSVHDVVSNDEHLVALVEAKAQKPDGSTLDYRTAEIHHVDDEGKITARWAFSDDTAAIVSFFS